MRFSSLAASASADRLGLSKRLPQKSLSRRQPAPEDAMSERSGSRVSCIELPTYDGDSLNAIIETPIGSHAKYAFDVESGLFKLKTVLPAGAVFPYNFGFLPSTQGEDGDPLDVLVLMEAAAYPGCLLPSRLIGVIEAEQTETEGEIQRNDRLIAVAKSSALYGEIVALNDLQLPLVEQIEHFFASYNKLRGKKWKPIGRHGSTRAERLIKHGIKRFRKEGLEPTQL
jgi:inorganic pyrophosphatase